MQYDVAQYGTHHGEQSDQGNTGTARFEGTVDRVADVQQIFALEWAQVEEVHDQGE